MGSWWFGAEGLDLFEVLVELVVGFVEVGLGGWDTHYDNFASVEARAAILDKGFSTLVQDNLRRSERLELLGQLSGGLAHQLRNSITGARVAIQLHQKKCDLKNDQLAETAIAQLRLTEEQVRAVLTLKATESQTGIREPVNLSGTLQEVCELVKPYCIHWRSEVDLSVPEHTSEISLVSPSCLKGAFLNLIMNGIEASGTNGRLRIECYHTADSVIVEIRDSGDGFAEPYEELLDAFHTTKPDGVGLGLTIARHAIEQESGRLTVDRTDGWTIVKVEIPTNTP